MDRIEEHLAACVTAPLGDLQRERRAYAAPRVALVDATEAARPFFAPH